MIYLSLYLLLSFLAIFQYKLKLNKSVNIFILILIFLFVATRFQTGGDWTTYKIFYENIYNVDYELYDLSYYTINYIIYNLFGSNGIVVKDFIFAFFFFSLFFLFILKNFDDTFFLLTLSFPILITLLSMGYIRQGLSVSCFFAFLSFKQYRYKLIFLYPMLTFHAFGVFLFSITILETLKVIFLKNFLPKFKLFLLILLIFFSILIFYNFFDIILVKFKNYITESHLYNSVGSLPRSLLNFACALLYLFVYFFKKEIIFKNHAFLFLIISLLILILLPLSFFITTAVDRIGVGLSFIQLIGPYYFIKFFDNFKIKQNLKICILIFFFIYYFTWIGFSSNYSNWVYQSLIFFK